MPTPSLEVSFLDPNGKFDGYRAALTDTLKAAWDLWAQHIESDETITIRIAAPQDATKSDEVHATASQTFWYPTDLPKTADGGTPARGTVVEKLVTGFDGTPDGAQGKITIHDSMSIVALPTDNATEVSNTEADFLNVFTHEIGHLLGIADGYFQEGYPGIYQTYLKEKPDSGFDGQQMFDGPEVREHFGGPIDLNFEIFGGAGSDPSHFDSTNDIMYSGSSNENAHVSRADLAVLADIGLPIRESSLTGPILGTSGVDTQRGTLKDDILAASAGDDILSGEDGTDTVVYPGNAADYQVVDGRIQGPQGDDLLESIERAQFADQTVWFDGTPPSDADDLLQMDVPDQVSTIYIGYFGRAGGPAGADYWQDEIQQAILNGNTSSVALKGIAESFRKTPEGGATYPFLATDAQSTAGADEIGAFVRDIYQNLFNRAPAGTVDDPTTGLGYWVDTIQQRLADGVQIGDVIVDIASGATGDDSTTLGHRIEVASYFADTLDAATFDALTDSKATARSVLDGVDAKDSSVVDAQAEIDALIPGSASLTADDGSLI